MIWRGLLVSVRDATEARAALDGDAAIIDVKEPANGPLGRPTADIVAAVARAVAGRRPLTVAAGELAAGLDRAREPDWHAAAAVKIGLAGEAADHPRWEDRLRRWFARMPPAVARVAVAYADWPLARSPHPATVIDAASRLGCTAVLIDTFDKSGPGLLTGCCEPAALVGWVVAARGAGLRVAVAGRLGLDGIAAAWNLDPDVVAVRSAVCSGGRFGRVEADLVRIAARMTPAVSTPPYTPATTELS